MRLKAKREVALVMVTGNAFQTLIDLKKKLLAILFVRQKGFNREGINAEQMVINSRPVSLGEVLSKSWKTIGWDRSSDFKRHRRMITGAEVIGNRQI